ncbi:MAG: PaaI family thioesterase [Burkholderiaceae bacterium]|nr:PaaI family thioesterase [Burkholderiaceae bacterium]
MTNENTTQATLDAWQAQLDQVRQRRLARGGGKAGLAQPHQVQGKTGLQVMTALLEGDLPHPYMADTFDCELVELGDGVAIFQATPQLKHYNPLGSVHGGWYATLLDFALGCAVQTKLPAGRGYTTSQINVNIVRAAHMKTGPLRCVGTALHVGRQVGMSEARIVGPDGKLYAHATTTCVIFDRHQLRLDAHPHTRHPESP